MDKLFIIPKHFFVDSFLLDTGLDSIQVMLWLRKLRQQEYVVVLRQFYENQTISSWS
ncbi:phosphopantetheine-binding protein [Gilliamella apicola]|uniref:phosphopantetheine-binding protein n=1 Tax=Gilliamella apicola TaxID=1196095 RepID=UPI003420B849